MGAVFALLFLCLASFVHAADIRYQGVRPDFIIDVRTPAEFASGHIEGAINIPVERIAEDLRTMKQIRPGSTLLLYCRSGRRSAIAAELIRQQGYSRVLDGGGIERLAGELKSCAKGAC